MATYYWVGGAGTWNTTSKTNWASTSGGTGGSVGPPGTADDAVFDANSGAGTVTCSSGVCNNLTISNSPVKTITGTLSVYSSLTASTSVASLTLSSLTLTFAATGTGKTVNVGTLAGVTNTTFAFAGVGGVWTLNSGLSYTGLTITQSAGSLNTNGQTLSLSSFTNTGTSARTLTLGTSSITVTGSFSIASATGLTLSAASSTIRLDAATLSIPTGVTIGNVTLIGLPSTLTGPGTIGGNLTTSGLTGGWNSIIYLGGNLFVTGNLTISGGSQTSRYLIAGNLMTSTRTLTVSGTRTVSNCDFRNITIAGAALTGTSLGNCGGNTNITFTAALTRYAVTASSSFSSIGWSSTSGGASDGIMPLPQDTVVFDSGSAAGTYTLGTTGTSTIRVGTISVTNTFSRTIDTSSGGFEVYGNFTLAGGTANLVSGPAYFKAAGSTTVTLNGRSLNGGVDISGPNSSTVTFSDTLNCSDLTFTTGSASFGTNNVNADTVVVVTATQTRTIDLGSGTWTITPNAGSITLFDFSNPGTGGTITSTSTNLVFSDNDVTSAARTLTAQFNALTFNSLTFAGSQNGTIFYLRGGATFGTIASTKTTPFTIQINNAAGNGITFTNWTVTGSATAPILLQTNGSGNQTLTCTTGTVTFDYFGISSIDGTGGATFVATNSYLNKTTGFATSGIDLGENSNYVITLTSGTSWTKPADWNVYNNTIHLFGGGGGGGTGAAASAGRAGGGGGGGGGYTKINNFSAGGGTINYTIGAGGTANNTGGNTTFYSGTYTANGGGAGSATSGGFASSTGGAGGTGSTYNGGTGGAGGATTTASTGGSGGGGGGAGGVFGNGANGGTGTTGATSAYAAGGGGGNSGGSAGGNASGSTSGAGGNNVDGTGGGASVVGGNGNGGIFGGGGSGSGSGSGSGGAGGDGYDYTQLAGTGGGGGGSAQTGNGGNGTGGIFGGGGGGGGTNTTTTGYSGAAGGAGGIVIVYGLGSTGGNTFFLLF